MKNKEDDISTWTCEYCKSFLKLHKASLQGNKKELIDRCVLLKFLIENNLECMISLSKMELKSMSSALTLPFGEGITKDDMIRNVSDVLLGIFGDMSNGVLALIEEEESELDLMQLARMIVSNLMQFCSVLFLILGTQNLHFFLGLIVC